ncbi:MAG: hypothetical protein R6U70_07880 [Bacillota bacterium]
MIGVWSLMFLIAALHLPELIRQRGEETAAFIVLWLAAGIYASVIFSPRTAGQWMIPSVVDVLTTVLSRMYQWMGLNWL